MHFLNLLFAVKKQQKYIKEKFALVDDEIHDEEENGEDNKEVWGGKKPQYYGGKDYEVRMWTSYAFIIIPLFSYLHFPPYVSPILSYLCIVSWHLIYHVVYNSKYLNV